MRNLDLALIGNGAIGLLVDAVGTIVWGCFPRFDGDTTFCALLDDAPRARSAASTPSTCSIRSARSRTTSRTRRCS